MTDSSLTPPESAAELIGDPSELASDPSELTGDPSELASDPSELTGDPSELASDPSELASESALPPLGEDLLAAAPSSDAAADSTSGDGYTGTLLWGVALLALLAALLSRAIAPALPGVWVGIDHVITATKLAAALSSQLTAVCVSALVMALVVTTLRRHVPSGLRAFSVGVGALVVLAVMIGSATRLPQLSGMIVGLGAVLLAVALMAHSARLLGLRAAALVVLATATAGALRLAATACSLWVIKGGSSAWGTVGRSLATLSMFALAAAVALTLVWLLTQPDRVGSRALAGRLGTTGLALVCGLLVALLAYRGGAGDAEGVTLLLGRMGQRLTPYPMPYFPPIVRVAVEALSWSCALAVLLRAPRTRLMSAAVAMALIGDAMVEMPLAAGLLVVSALALLNHPAIDLRDELRNNAKPAPAS